MSLCLSVVSSSTLLSPPGPGREAGRGRVVPDSLDLVGALLEERGECRADHLQVGVDVRGTELALAVRADNLVRGRVGVVGQGVVDAGQAGCRFGDEKDGVPELDALHVVDGARDPEGRDAVDILDLDAVGDGLSRCMRRDLAGEVEAERLGGLSLGSRHCLQILVRAQ